MNASFDSIDYLIRRSIEGPDNPVAALIMFFLTAYAIAAIVLIVAGIVGLIWKSKA